MNKKIVNEKIKFVLFFVFSLFLFILFFSVKNLSKHDNKTKERKNQKIAGYWEGPRVTKEKKRFVVLIYAYNNMENYEECLRSVLNQKYSNFRILYLDNCSQDGSVKKARDFLSKNTKDNRFMFLARTEHERRLDNLYHVIHNFCFDDEIVVLLCGQDFFAHDKVLSTLNEVFADSNTWLAYGRHINYPSYLLCEDKPFTKKEIRKQKLRYRKGINFGLRAFYAALFKKIALEDLLYEGRFFSFQKDYVMMIPMLEMAKHHIAYIPNVLYLRKRHSYNPSKAFIRHCLIPHYRKKIRDQLPSKPLKKSPYVPYQQADVKKANMVIIGEKEDPSAFEITLSSIQNKIEGLNNIYVIHPFSSSDECYKKLKERFPDIIWCSMKEKALKPLLCQKITEMQDPYIFLLRTGRVIDQFIDIEECGHVLTRVGARGFYFFLGKEGISHSGRGDYFLIPSIESISVEGGIQAWHMEAGEQGDWVFPDGVIGTLYERLYLVQIFEQLSFHDIASLEKNWALRKEVKQIGLFLYEPAISIAEPFR